MTLLLGFWKREWQSVLYDTDSGNGRVKWLSGRPPEDRGWAHKYKGKWYAVWSSGEYLVFQSGSERRQMTNEYRCENRFQGTFREFNISPTNGDFPVLRIVYPHVDRLNDPTFDDADKEQEDFFLWVFRLWNDEPWKTEAARNWASCPGDLTA